MTLALRRVILTYIITLFTKDFRISSEIHNHVKETLTSNNVIIDKRQNFTTNLQNGQSTNNIMLRTRKIMSTTGANNFSLTKTTITTPHRQTNMKRDLDLRIIIAIPVGLVILIIFIIILVIFIKRRIRTRRLQREFLPHYGYDNSEAEMFDGYTQYTEGVGSIERLSSDNSRYKASSPEGTVKSDASLTHNESPISA